jgi:hypothetical protein
MAGDGDAAVAGLIAALVVMVIITTVLSAVLARVSFENPGEPRREAGDGGRVPLPALFAKRKNHTHSALPLAAAAPPIAPLHPSRRYHQAKPC